MTGKELRKRRRDLELSQVQIAKRLDVCDKTVCLWEAHGEKKLPVLVGFACEHLFAVELLTTDSVRSSSK